MATETGHDVNIANFLTIITRCTEFGTRYNPINTDITIANMTTKHTAVNGFQTDYLSSNENTRILINTREEKFDVMKGIVVRANNGFKSTKAGAMVKKDARGHVNKICGRYLKIKKLEDGSPDPNHVSKSQQGFVKSVTNFEKFLELLDGSGFYGSNEADLKMTAMETLLAELKQLNEDVDESNANTLTKRQERNHGLYDAETGVVDITLACKNYVKSIYGATAIETKGVTSIEIRRVMRLKPA